MSERFVNYPFQATLAPTPRTMPTRLSEIQNVLDWGADPTGVSDSQPAVQNAVNWTTGANRGTIYFPLGKYTFNSPVTYNYNGNLSIRFLGEAGGTLIGGNFNGYLFDRSLVTPNNTTGFRIFEKLTMSNAWSPAQGGCIRMGSTDGGAIIDCGFNANGNCFTSEDSPGNSSTAIMIQDCQIQSNNSGNLGGNGIVIGGSGSITGTDFANLDTCVRAYGKGLYIAGNRAEVSNTAYLFGLDSAGTNQGWSGCYISGTMEGDAIGIHLAGSCNGFFIGGFEVEGHDQTNSGYPRPPGQRTQYHVKIDADAAYNGVFQGVDTGNIADVACVSIANATARTGLVFRNCSVLQTGGTGVNWINPTNAYTATFINCNNQPIWAFSQLPSGANVFEGDEFNVSDINSAWGTTYTGGGTTHGLVRWNGTNYTVVAQ